MPDKSRGKTSKKSLPLLLNLLASKWTILVITALQHNTLRFHEIQKTLSDTTQKSLTETLRKLERSGMVERTLYPTIPPQVEYKLTSLGIELLKLSEVVTGWAQKYDKGIQRAQKAYDSRPS